MNEPLNGTNGDLWKSISEILVSLGLSSSFPRHVASDNLRKHKSGSRTFPSSLLGCRFGKLSLLILIIYFFHQVLLIHSAPEQIVYESL